MQEENKGKQRKGKEKKQKGRRRKRGFKWAKVENL